MVDVGAKKRTVLYHAMTAYQFLQCLIDKIYNNRESKGIFLISKFISNAYPNYLELVNSGYFDHILIFDFRVIANCKTIEEFEDKAVKYYDEMLGQIGIRIEDCDEVHIAGAHQAFGSYACLKRVPFYFYEEGAGVLSRNSGLSKFVHKRDPIKNEIAIKYGLYEGNNELVIEARCVLDAQAPNYSNDKARNYEVIELMSKLSKNDIDYLLKFFNVPLDLEGNEKYTMIMGQQLTRNGEFFTVSERILTYQLLIDYYLSNENVILKPHPADRSPYEDYMDDVDVFIMRSKFPSEFLPFVPNIKINKIITINSSSVNNLNEFIDEIQILDKEYLDFYPAIHRYNVAFDLMKLIQSEQTSYFHYGVSDKQIQNFVKNCIQDDKYVTSRLNLKNIPSNSVSIINNLTQDESLQLLSSMENVDDSVVLIFVNQNEDYRFYNPIKPDLINYFVPLTIKKRRLKKNILADLKDETIYVFCKDTDTRRKIMYHHFNKELRHTGISLEIVPHSKQERKITMLEARISSLELLLRDLFSVQNKG